MEYRLTLGNFRNILKMVHLMIVTNRNDWTRIVILFAFVAMPLTVKYDKLNLVLDVFETNALIFDFNFGSTTIMNK